jgi:hypothetical protein
MTEKPIGITPASWHIAWAGVVPSKPNTVAEQKQKRRSALDFFIFDFSATRGFLILGLW